MQTSIQKNQHVCYSLYVFFESVSTLSINQSLHASSSEAVLDTGIDSRHCYSSNYCAKTAKPVTQEPHSAAGSKGLWCQHVMSKFIQRPWDIIWHDCMICQPLYSITPFIQQQNVPKALIPAIFVHFPEMWHQTAYEYIMQLIEVRKEAYSSLCYKHCTATRTHVQYGITQCYLQRWHSHLYPSQLGWYSIQWPQRDARLSWPSWLGYIPRCIPTKKRSPIPVLTGLNVEQLRSYD